MAVNYTVNGVDLDNIFAPRTGTKRADIQLLYNGVDLSNTYESSTSSADQISYNTGFQTNGTDLRYVFRDKNYTRLVIRIYTFAETAGNYGRYNDGSIQVQVDTTYAKLNNTNTQYNFTLDVGGTAYTRSIPASDPLGYKTLVTRSNLNATNYGVTVTDVNSGNSLYLVVNVPYGTPASRTYNESTT
jgi:hypothetical protein